MTKEQLVKLFDHTCLYAYATEAHMKKLCDEARAYNFAMVAVNSVQVKLCKKFLKDTDVHVGAAIGFPLGQTTIASKVFETVDAIQNGADEIDYVINITELKDGNYDYIREEMRQIVAECRKANVISKVIFENCYLTQEEKEILCKIALEVKPDFIKTSTGFSKAGATFHDVELFAKHVKPGVKIKAAGGISSLDDAEKFIELGASRLGTSRVVKIVKKLEAEEK